MAQLDLKFYKRLFSTGGTALIVTVSSAGEPITEMSDSCKHLLDIDALDLDSHSFLYDNLIHEDDIAQYLIESQQGLNEVDCDEISHSEYRLQHRAGHYVWVKDNAQLIRDNGAIKHVIHMLTDITKEIGLREEVTVQKKRLEDILHHAGFGIWEWAVGSEAIYCDQNWAHLIGFVHRVDNMKLSRLLALVHPDDLSEFNSMLSDLAEGKYYEAELVVRLRHLSGNWRYHQCHASIYGQVDSVTKSIANAVVVVSHNDITFQKENELAAISALSTRNQFFARVSHEIRTPLHGILGMLSMVKRDLNSEKAQQKIDKITTHSEQLLYLLNDILDLAKLNEAKLKVSVEMVSVSEIMNQVHRLFIYKAQEKSIDFKVTLPDLKQDIILTDKVRLTQILTNLVSNGIKYTHKGGVHLYTELKHDLLILCIQDTGIGIKDPDSIFDAYKQEQGGQELGTSSTGLGLEIVKKLCDLLGIEIRLASESEGSLFELILTKPMPNTISATKKAKIQNTSAIKLSDVNVLIVDDSDINCEIVAEMLQSVGAISATVGDGYAAVKEVSQNPIYDVVLMDKHMPKMNGIDATYEIRKVKNLPKEPIIIALTADAFDIDNENWFEAGIDDLITKPFDMDILIKTISRLLRH